MAGVNGSGVVSALRWREDQSAIIRPDLLQTLNNDEPAYRKRVDLWELSCTAADLMLKFERGAAIKTHCNPTTQADLHYCDAEGEPQGFQNECIYYCGRFRNLPEMETTAYIRKCYSNFFAHSGSG